MSQLIPSEFDIIQTGNVQFPFGIGFTMKGWDFSSKQISRAIDRRRMLNPAVELASNICPWNCSFCYTEHPETDSGSKTRLKHEMSLADRLKLINDLADLGAKSINIVGAGEPTIDPHFFELLEEMQKRGITPIVYTEGALKMTDRAFAQHVFDLGATVVFKVNSLHNAEYQNAIVLGDGIRKPVLAENYTARRNEAIELCMDIGFNKADPTRLAFDTIVCKQNIDEIETLHRWTRTNNIFVLFVNYLTSGRSSDVMYDALSRDEQFALFARLAEIDRTEFHLEHASTFPYAGGTPCSIRGLGLYVKNGGAVYDCPGEGELLGDLKKDPIAQIWERTKHIQATFDGGCLPREKFWKRVRQRTTLEQKAK